MQVLDYDVLFLYNERETAVDTIATELQGIGYKVFIWRRDVEYGTEVDADETRIMRTVPMVLVFLGNQGWGPNHLRLFEEARKLERKIIPVLIGEVSNKDLAEADGFFRRIRYVDLRNINNASIINLANAIGKPGHTPDATQNERIINTLIVGNDDQRADALRQVQQSSDTIKASLAPKLRAQIMEQFNPHEDRKNAAYTAASPERIPSIRSWMLSCLIAADPKNELNKDVILRHLDAEYEKNNNVQYWVLAGLYLNGVQYMYDAAEKYLQNERTKRLSFSEVLLLARAIVNSDGLHISEKFTSECRSLLISDNSQEIWAVLRMLRIVPMPALVPDICQLLNRRSDIDALTYDAFYALSNHGMPQVAAPLLTDVPGIKNITIKIINVLANGWGYTVGIFARILLPLDANAVDAALSELRNDPQTRLIANKLRNSLAELREGDDSNYVSYRRNISDGIDVKKDLLNIAKDVRTISAIVAAKGASLPLAIGLLGGWGSGKSFFMQSMQEEIRKLEDKGDKGQSYCTNIVQIDFNAWHYVDDHLLASLVDHIFDKLSRHVSPEKTDDERETELKAHILKHEDDIKKAQELEATTKQAIAEKEKELEQLKLDRANKAFALSDWTVEDIKKILGKENTQKIKKSMEEMGIPGAVNSVTDLNKVISEVQTVSGHTSALFFSILNSKHKLLILSLLAATLLIVPFIFWLMAKYANMDTITANILSISSQIVVIVSSITVMLRKALGRVKSAVNVVDDAREEIEKVIAGKKNAVSDAEKALDDEITILKASEKIAIETVTTATVQAEAIKNSLAIFMEERSLTKFLSDRRSSGDYKKHLGVISTIRRDFEYLIDKLDYARKHQNTKYVPVDRIVLYIDDLDRCPAPKVMEVLQAVHLLLAYELFVVVVGVDPQWLLRSLESEHSVFQNSKNNNIPETGWQGTPQSFLEKIFQIPFRLRTMSTTGYGKLMKELFGSSTDAVATSNGDTATQGNMQLGSKDTSTNTREDTDTETLTNSSGTGILLGDNKEKAKASLGEKKQQVVDEESLIITPWETQFAEELFTLIPTPRSAKRFANVYCILKAAVSLDQLSDFEGTSEAPGEFRVPMLLLAILIGAPKEAKLLFPILSRSGSISLALQKISTDELPGSPIGMLTGKIHEIINSSSFPNSTDLFKHWTRQVSRFSFELILSD